MESNNKPENPRVFPLPVSDHNLGYEGMELRDYFAGKALQGAEKLWVFEKIDEETAKNIAMISYKIADAMLEARQSLQVIGDYWLENPTSDISLTDEDREEIRKRVVIGLPTPFFFRMWANPCVMYRVERFNRNTVIVGYVMRIGNLNKEKRFA